MHFHNPPKTITCWVTLDQTATDAGTLEYVPGSHLWPLTPIPADFHAPDDYRGLMKRAAREAGVENPEPFFIDVPAGSCVFHAGEIWHGSGPNVTGDVMRRSIGVHMVPADAQFSDRHGGYIYRRYQRTGDTSLDDKLLPDLVDEGRAPDRLDRDLLRHRSTRAGAVGRRRVNRLARRDRLSDLSRAISAGRYSHRIAAAMLPPSTVVTSAVVLSASA